MVVNGAERIQGCTKCEMNTSEYGVYGEILVLLTECCYNTSRRNAALIMRGVGVFSTPRRGACKPGTGTGFSSRTRGSAEYGTLRRTSFFIRTS